MKTVPGGKGKETDADKYMDIEPSEVFIEKTVEVFGGNENSIKVLKMFKGNKSRDFYLGIMAGLNISMQAIHSFPVAMLKEALMDANVAAAVTVSKKKSKIITE